MAKLVSAWTDKGKTYLVERVSDHEVKLRSVPARYSFFMTGLDDEDRADIARDSNVKGVSVDEYGYTRVECFGHWERKNILEILESAVERNHWNVEILEGDVSPLRRLLSDIPSLEIDPEPRCLFIDIETDSRRTFEEARSGQARVLSWASCDHNGENIHSAVLETDSDSSEKVLFNELFEVMNDYDCILAWNGSSFDFDVIQSRAFSLGFYDIRWHRWTWLDHLEVYKHHNSLGSGDEKTSYALDHVARYLLKEGKLDFDSSKTWQAWEKGGESRRKLLEYNIRDTTLLPRIEQKSGYLALHFAVCQICRVFPDTQSLSSTAQGDGFMIRLGDEHGIRWPTRKRIDEAPEKFKGAFVMEPTRLGAIDNVHVADFSGLYPSIMRTFNMSPDTKVSRLAMKSEDFCQLPERETYFRTDKVGMFTLALNQLVKKRGEYSNLMKEQTPGSDLHKKYQRLSQAFKVVANSFYGIIGSPFSRFFDAEIAEGVTQTGKWLITNVIEAATNVGLDPFYGDSIPGYRPVVLKRPDGRLFIDTIESYWNAYRVGEWKALTEQGWQPVKRIIRHKVSKDIWSIWDKYGHVEVTEDHSLIVNGVETKPEEFVNTNESFTVIDPIRARESSMIDIYEYLKDFVVIYPYKGRAIIRQFDADNKKVWLCGWGNPKVFFDRYYFSGTEEIDALLRVCASYCADGSSSLRGITTSRFLWSVCKQDDEWLCEIGDDLSLFCNASLFGPYWSKGSNVYVLRSGTADMSMFFAALCGYRSQGKKVPEFVFELPKSEMLLFFDRLVSGDGSIDGNGKKYSSSSSVLISGVSYLLGLCGIEHSHRYREDKKHWSIRTRPDGTERDRNKRSWSVRKSSDEYVYDLEVEGAHTFVDGVGRILLHNTDSVFVSGDSNRFKELVRELNDSWSERLEPFGIKTHHIDLDFEKTFRRVIMITAKRYVGTFLMYKGKEVPADAPPEVKGLEFNRGDSIKLAREFQKRIVDKLLEPDLPAPETIRQLIDDQKRKVYRGEFELEDIIMSQSLSKPIKEYKAPVPAHVRVAKILKERGEQIIPGTRVYYIVIPQTDKKDKKLNPVPVDDITDLSQVDRAYYWEKRVYPPVERVVEKVYPSIPWKETTAEKRARRQEMEGQMTLFDPLESGKSTGKPRTRKRRKKKSPTIPTNAVIVTLQDRGPDDSPKIIKAVKAIAEAYPGDLPLTLVLKPTLRDRSKAKVTISTQELISRSCRVSLERVLGKGDSVQFPTES